MAQMSSMLPGGQSQPFGAAPTSAPVASPMPSGPFGAAPVQPPPQMAGGPFSVSPMNPSGQQTIRMLLPALLSAFGPKLGPTGTAALMTGLMQGYDNKRAMSEQHEQTMQRRAREAAEFRMNALKELMAAESPEAFDAMRVYLEPLAQFHGMDLSRELDVARGVSETRQTSAASARQRAAAADVVKHNDQTNPGQWSAADEDGVMRSREWWVNRAGTPGMLPMPAKKTDQAKTREVRTRNKDGSESIRIVEDTPGQTFESAAEPQDPAEQEWVMRGGTLVPIAKGTRQPGDQPYQAPSQSQPSAEWVRDAQGNVHKRAPRPGDMPYSPTMARDEMNRGNRVQARSSMISKALDTIRLLKTIPGKGGAVGAGFQKAIPFVDGPLPGTSARTYTQYINALKSQLTLPELEKLRGLGAMSDREFRTLSEGATALDASMDEASFDAELGRLEAALLQMQAEQIQPGDTVTIDPSTRGGVNLGAGASKSRFSILEVK